MKSGTAAEECLFLTLLRWLFQTVSVGDVDRTIAARRLVNRLSLQKMTPSFLLDVAARSAFLFIENSVSRHRTMVLCLETLFSMRSSLSRCNQRLKNDLSPGNRARDHFRSGTPLAPRDYD